MPFDSPQSSRVPVGSTSFDNLTMAQTVGRIVEMTSNKSGRTQLVCTGNLDHLVLLSKDDDFKKIYDCADLVVADGEPVIWLSKISARKLGVPPLCERVAGSDLFWELGRASAETALKIFLLGGSPGAADSARDAVIRKYPNAQIVGTYCPPFETFGTPAEQSLILSKVAEANPDVLMVAFGAPKQEKWIDQNKFVLGVPVAIGVGGSFEMAAGVVKRAPQWMRRTGTEWFFRFLQEPTRLWDRYFKNDMPFLLSLAIRTAVAPPAPRDTSPTHEQPS